MAEVERQRSPRAEQRLLTSEETRDGRNVDWRPTLLCPKWTTSSSGRSEGGRRDRAGSRSTTARRGAPTNSGAGSSEFSGQPTLRVGAGADVGRLSDRASRYAGARAGSNCADRHDRAL